VVFLAVVVGGACVADVFVRGEAERALAAAVEREAPGTHGTSASIGSFPFVGRLVVRGQVPVVTVRAREARAAELPLRDVSVTVHDVHLDTGQAVKGKVRITSAGHGSLDATVTQDDLNRRLPGVHVVLTPGQAEVGGPAGVKGELVTSTKGRLVLRVAGRTLFEIPLAVAGLLPCEPEVAIDQGALRLSCSFDDVPDVLLRAASR
jgi:hypothetical protein